MTDFQLGIDVGGTFTDFVLLDISSGTMHRGKCLSTPDDPVRGIVHGIRQLCAEQNIAPDSIRRVVHGTTLVTNTLIEQKGARTGLLTTEGFQDILELGADQRYDMYDLAIKYPPPLAERDLRLGVRERVGSDGSVIAAPSPDDVMNKVTALRDGGATSIAVCFLHSYRNPENEEDVARIIAESFPDLEVSISSRIAPEIREYERTVTVLANAYVKPVARSYLIRLEKTLVGQAVTAPVLVMLSNGGVAAPSSAAEVPIRVLESGPAAGVLAACHAGKHNAANNLLAFDMGGTTAKGCFIDHGEPAFTGSFEAARAKPQFRGSGYPLKIPSIDLVEIGAGGGSIARIDKTGLLKVGPTSAGAVPGPVCYGRGGVEPTVTDADVLLGYLDPGNFLGGTMPLDLDGARDAMARLGEQCGLDALATAAGVSQVVNQNMATAFRIHAAERGKDCRRYDLFAFGGAGPVHCYEVARLLGAKHILSPIGGGTNSAFGLLVSPAATDLARSWLVRLDDIDWDRLNTVFATMEAEAQATLSAAGENDIRFSRSAELHFAGQGFELTVPVPAGPLSAESASIMIESFRQEYRKIYETLPGDLPVEAVTWRLRGYGASPDIQMSNGGKSAAPRQDGSRPAYFTEIKGFADSAVIDRTRLAPGDRFQGPALVEEQESTLVIGPGGSATVNQDLSITVAIDYSDNAVGLQS